MRARVFSGKLSSKLRTNLTLDFFPIGQIFKTRVSVPSIRLISVPSDRLIYSLAPVEDGVTTVNLYSLLIGLQTRNRHPTIKETRISHAYLFKTGVIHLDIVIANTLVDSYCKCSAMRDALQMVGEMLVPNSFTFSSILTACAAIGDLDMVRGVHGWVLKCGAEDDIYVGTAILDLYAKCGDMDEALKECLWMPFHNVVSWTAIISGFIHNEDCTSALQFLIQMREKGEEVDIYPITIQLHCWILKSGFCLHSTVGDSLINMYSKLGEVDMAEVVFRESGNTKQVGTWASIISAFSQNQNFGRTVEFFGRMLQEGLNPDVACCSSTLSIIECLHLGRQIHCYVFKAGLIFDVSVASALLTMYSKCDSLKESCEVFEQMNDKDEKAWTSMIAGFAEHGCADRAFNLFQKMQLEEIRISEDTLAAVLTACCSPISPQKGKEVHGHAVRMGVALGTLVGGALVTMYWKCDDLFYGVQVFKDMPKKDQFSRASMLLGYAKYAYDEEAFLMFNELLMHGLEIDCFVISTLLLVATLSITSDPGKQMHAYVMKKGLHSDLSVASSLVTMYSRHYYMHDARKVFDWIERPDLVTWKSMIQGYVQNKETAEAVRLYKLMIGEGMIPDSETFLGVLLACSREGLVEEGFLSFNLMTRDYGIEPGPIHYACLVDLLGKKGRLIDAENLIRNMPIEPDTIVWRSLLISCLKWGDFDLGRLAAEKILELDPGDASIYIRLAGMCRDRRKKKKARKMREIMKQEGIKENIGWGLF